MLSRPDDPAGRIVAKMRIPASPTIEPERKVHPGHDWFYVLDGTVRLVLGGRENLVATGEAASFSTMTPHAMFGVGGPRGDPDDLRPPRRAGAPRRSLTFLAIFAKETHVHVHATTRRR